MGRQIAVVASPADERSFLSFLRGLGSIQLCVEGAETAAELWPDEFPPYHHTRAQFFDRNQEFRWTPKVVQPTPEGGGLIENLEKGPVIEFDRTAMHMFSVEQGICLGRGRIYWAQKNRHKGFARGSSGWLGGSGVTGRTSLHADRPAIAFPVLSESGRQGSEDRKRTGYRDPINPVCHQA